MSSCIVKKEDEENILSIPLLNLAIASLIMPEWRNR